MDQIILINGKQQSKLSVFNRLVQFGDGLFETCLVIRGKLVFAQDHFRRLEKGAKRLKIVPVKQTIWLKEIDSAISKAKLDFAVVKIILSRGETKRGYGYEDGILPTRIVIVSEVPALSNSYELSLCGSGYAYNQLLSEIKHCNRLEQILARANIKTQECIMLDPKGNVISVSQGNIFAINQGVITTPSLDKCGIEGTRRQIVIELANQLNISVKVCELSVSELLNSEEVFITNSVIGIKAIHQINEQKFTQHQLTDKLTERYGELINKTESLIVLKN
jgi:4-amino-4-deoxychorismate lyase